MALKFSEIKDKVYSEELSDNERMLVDEREEEIDSEIMQHFDGVKANVSSTIFDFYSTSPRQQVMKNYLIKKYNKAGWDIKYYMGEDDGPNRPGAEYYIFSEKK